VQTVRAAQKRYEDQEHYLTLVSFNSDAVKTIYDCVKAERVEELTAAQYQPNCATPLYDAMGNALNQLRKNVADNDAVLVTIITDGYENDSREYNSVTIKALVEGLKAKGWLFTYIGANQNVEEVAATISITNTLEFCANEAGTEAMFARERKARNRGFSRLSEKISQTFMADDYFADEDGDELKS
ncbi:MAG: VWA domain-containing protein, partial [Muribaculaceae bacterium]|nr:VWA domain-containing protein [Muribaculaceae bacterium]